MGFDSRGYGHTDPSVHSNVNWVHPFALKTLNPPARFLHLPFLPFSLVRRAHHNLPVRLLSFFLSLYLPTFVLMAFRGRGRGRGRGGFGLRLNGPASYTPYENFPDVEKLPDLAAIIHSSKELKEMAIRESQLDEFWRGSCYHLQEDALRAKKETETGRILGKRRKTQERREALAFYLKLTPSNFPGELIQGSRQVQQSNKKLKWDRHADHISLDKFEKLEEKHKDKDEKEDEDEEEEPEEEEPEESSDDDYNQNVDFDDDEDDMNMVEADEDYYE